MLVYIELAIITLLIITILYLSDNPPKEYIKVHVPIASTISRPHTIIDYDLARYPSSTSNTDTISGIAVDAAMAAPPSTYIPPNSPTNLSLKLANDLVYSAPTALAPRETYTQNAIYSVTS